jgi:hypothetical protein
MQIDFPRVIPSEVEESSMPHKISPLRSFVASVEMTRAADFVNRLL